MRVIQVSSGEFCRGEAISNRVQVLNNAFNMRIPDQNPIQKKPQPPEKLPKVNLKTLDLNLANIPISLQG